jgi:hypothetical protein
MRFHPKQRPLLEQGVCRAARRGRSIVRLKIVSFIAQKPLAADESLYIINDIDVFKENHALFPRPVNHVKPAKL